MANTHLNEVKVVQSVKVDIDLIDNNDGQIPGVKRNPREMTEMEFKKLKKSLLRNPDYTAISELKLFKLGERYVTIGGNMRLRAMKELGWREVVGKIFPENTPIDKLNEYILLDNANFGKWDFDALANEWEEELLSNMNIDVPKTSEVLGEECEHSKKISVPTYEPSGRKPELKELCDTAKRDELVAQIDAANIPSEIKSFLKLAAERHNVFNYEKIADFYAQADASVQELMERSALVIIDFNKAIENGFLRLSEELAKQYEDE